MKKLLFNILLMLLLLSYAKCDAEKSSKSKLKGDVGEEEIDGDMASSIVVEPNWKDIPECPPHSHYEECGSDCIPSCAKIFNDVPMKCSAKCIEGCFCDPGYIYDESVKDCVKPNDCIKIQCKDHEYFSECDSNCGKICHEDLSKECESLCEVGCFCEDGYFLDKTNNTCVRRENCTVTCGENQEKSDCGSTCPDTCENWANPNRKSECSTECVTGCFCKAGYVLETSESKKCIKKESCPHPPKCGENEYYHTGGNDCKNCHNYKYTTCRQILEPGCFCVNGYLRDKNYKCIAETICPDLICQETDPNSISTDCAVCLPSCQHQTSYLCSPACKWGCKCKEGFIKDDISGKCVTMEQCNQILAETAAKEAKKLEDETTEQPEGQSTKVKEDL